MTSTHSQTVMNAAKKFASDLVGNARSDVAAKLQAVDEACRSIIESGGTVSVSSVRGWVSTNRGISIAASTLMNLRVHPQTGEKEHSPARQIINRYVEVQKVSTKRMTSRAEPGLSSIVLSEREMKEIEDHQVRYKVQLMAGRLRNLETQLSQLRTINRLPTLPPTALSENYLLASEGQLPGADSDQDLSLDEEDLNALTDFLNESKLHRRKLEFDDNGALKVTHPARSDTATVSISKPFLADALRKILRSYARE